MRTRLCITERKPSSIRNKLFKNPLLLNPMEEGGSAALILFVVVSGKKILFVVVSGKKTSGA